VVLDWWPVAIAHPTHILGCELQTECSYFICDFRTVKLLARHRGKTISLSPNQIWNNCFIIWSMTSEHVRKTVKTIEQSTVREHRPFLEFQKTVKNTKLHLYKVSGNNLWLYLCWFQIPPYQGTCNWVCWQEQETAFSHHYHRFLDLGQCQGQSCRESTYSIILL